jgi:hypothetical protein
VSEEDDDEEEEEAVEVAGCSDEEEEGMVKGGAETVPSAVMTPSEGVVSEVTKFGGKSEGSIPSISSCRASFVLQ